MVLNAESWQRRLVVFVVRLLVDLAADFALVYPVVHLGEETYIVG